MKKIIPGVIVLVALAAAAFVFLKRVAVHRPRAAELLSAETLFFAQMPDLVRSAQRWPGTGLAKIWQEPEMQAFLAKPREKVGEIKVWGENLGQLERILPREAFVAVTAIEGPQPTWIAGLAYSGRQADVERLLAEGRKEFKRMQPAGKSDVVRHGTTEIETFTYAQTTVAEAFREEWYFVANNLDLLRATLDAVGVAPGAKSLAANPLFQQATAKLPAAGDVLLFAQLGALTERMSSLLVATGQAVDPKQLARMRKMQAAAWGTKIEGAQFRDTLFLLSPGGAAEATLPRSGLALSAPETFLYYAMALPGEFELPEASLPLMALVPGFGAMEAGLMKKGLKWSDFPLAFGPEFGSVVDWGPQAEHPVALLALDVRDLGKAKGFVEVFTEGLPGSPAWGSKEDEGVIFFQSPATAGLVVATPTMALTEKLLVMGFSPEVVEAGLARLKSGQAVIAQSPAYDAAAKGVSAPTAGFGYLDLRTLFERTYGTLRPFIAMSVALTPDWGKYLDASKLPGTETISKHLGPSVYSQSVSAEGTLVESVGTVTFNQVLIGVIGGTLASSLHYLESALAEGFKLDPTLLQLSAPGTALPPPAAPGTPAPTSVPVPVPDPATPAEL